MPMQHAPGLTHIQNYFLQLKFDLYISYYLGSNHRESYLHVGPDDNVYQRE